MATLEKYFEKYEAVIGLEVHAQLKTQTKIFCDCATDFGKPPNTLVCPICLGHPGVLPVLNTAVVEYAIRAALALNCEIHLDSRFARKNYFYPDLPKGYQISQFDRPIATGGFLMVPDDEKEPSKSQTRIGITRLHIEEDAGKLVHATENIDEAHGSLVDYNRAGTPLAEIVSEPDIRSFAQAGAYMRQLRSILRYLDVCDGNMEEGSLRCDANISVRPRGQKEFGVKAEVKNVNSFKFVEKALEYEYLRQCELLEYGGKVVQETRLWDPAKGVTRSMRGKEGASDYRYFPEPDLPPLIVGAARVEKIKNGLAELPVAKAIRFHEEYGLPHYDAGVLTAELDAAKYFEQALAAMEGGATKENAKAVSNWVMAELFGLLKADTDRAIAQSPVAPVALAGLVMAVRGGKITGKIGKDVLAAMYQTGKPADAIIAEQGLAVMGDEGKLREIAEKVVAGNPAKVDEFRAGRDKLLGMFVGLVMKETGGKADPKRVNAILLELLKK